MCIRDSGSTNSAQIVGLAKCIPSMLRAVALAPQNETTKGQTVTFFRELTNLLWDQVSIEEEAHVKIALLDALRVSLEIVAVMGANDFLAQDSLSAWKRHLIQCISDVDLHRKLDEEHKDLDDSGDEDGNNGIDIAQEEEVLIATAHIIAGLLRTHISGMSDFIEIIYQNLIPEEIPADASPKKIQFALSLLCGIVSHANFYDLPPKCQTFTVDMLLAQTGHQVAQVRQTAIFGLGVFVQRYAQSIDVQFVGRVVQGIVPALADSQETRTSRPLQVAREVAISALGKVLIAFALPQKEKLGEGDLDQLLTLWLSCLPVRLDLTQVIESHTRLLEAILQYETVVVGPEMSNLPIIVKILFEIIGRGLGTKEILAGAVLLLRQLAGNTQTVNVVHGVFQTLEPTLQEKTKPILTGQT
eukprot:TRINITY_DN9321_c0_g1_i1.p1 TRINITY_DN9321_c0_g1~~TRINITY_DN9321_c0_g1_i1.p1  ORF type:complete len:435 (-),score=106.72 TRINITY_DN9321_c0_g1_i1:11-1255(-)